MRRRRDLPFGAEIAEGGVRFRLWTPRARSVAVALEGCEGPWPTVTLASGLLPPGSAAYFLADRVAR